MWSGQANRILGYPGDARLLLVNADDFGMYRAINEAIPRTIGEGIVRSTSLMVPCPGAPQALRLLREHPEIPFGVHLSVIRDIDHYHWGPVSPREAVPSLLDEGGDFHSTERLPEMLAKAKLRELELEFRAQIEATLAAELHPTHLDWHCLFDGGRSDVFDMTLGLAREYGLALRVSEPSLVARVQGEGLPTVDHGLLDSFRVDIVDKANRYSWLLRELPEGLTEWAVHPSLGDAESQAIDPGGWRIRRADFDYVMSLEAREIVRREGITLIGYGLLQKLWD